MILKYINNHPFLLLNGKEFFNFVIDNDAIYAHRIYNMNPKNATDEIIMQELKFPFAYEVYKKVDNSHITWNYYPATYTASMTEFTNKKYREDFEREDGTWNNGLVCGYCDTFLIKVA